MQQRRGRRSSRSRDMHKKIKPLSEPSTNPNIPQEIIEKILTRLPHESLCRFRCVSKQWFSLISESKLVSRSKTPKVLVLSKLGDGSFFSFSFHSIDQQCSVEKIQTPWEKNQHLIVNIYGSCHGLLLLGLGVDLYLWNPLNGYFKKVLSYHRFTPHYVIRGGLCFDSSTNGYKAVIAFRPFFHSCKWLMVGNFRRKSWKEVPFPYKVSEMRPGPVVDGRLHWFARKSTGTLLNHRILSFDPRLDKFKRVPMPKPPKDGDRDVLLGLGVLDDCLCMIRHDNPTHSKGNAEVWVMKEYGEKKSWNLMFVISSETFTVWAKVVPLCCTKNGEVLTVRHIGYDGGCVTAFNSSGDLVWDLRNPSNCGHSINAVAYEETSVKPAGYTWENEDQSGIATYVEHCLSSSPRKMIKGKGDGKWDYLDPEEEEGEETGKNLGLKTNRPS